MRDCKQCGAVLLANQPEYCSSYCRNVNFRPPPIVINEGDMRMLQSLLNLDAQIKKMLGGR